MKLAVTVLPLQINNVIYYFYNYSHLLRVLKQMIQIKVNINLKGFNFGCPFCHKACY